MTRGKQTNGGLKKTETENQASKEAAMATRTTLSSNEQVAPKQEEKQCEELIADWDEMYVGVSMMLSVSTCNSWNILVECCSFSSDLRNSLSVRTSFFDFSDPPSEFSLPMSTRGMRKQ
jgi:hypothetical protein